MKDLPKRKHPRLKAYDYSSSGYYFVTINTNCNVPILCSVGRGFAPAEEPNIKRLPICSEAFFVPI